MPGLPVPSPTTGAYSNSCPLSWWCHPAISFSVNPFFSCPQSLPASGSFPINQLFTWGGQSIGVSASASVLPMNTQDWSPLGWNGWISLQSKGLYSLPNKTLRLITVFVSILISRFITWNWKISFSIELSYFCTVWIKLEGWGSKGDILVKVGALFDAFELQCWRRLLKVPWTARRSNQSILKEINPEYSLEELMLKLKFQNFCYLLQRVDTSEKTLTLEKIESRRRKGQQRMRWLDSITDSMDMSLSKLQKTAKDKEA